MSRVAILFDNFGPYHLARLAAAAGACDLGASRHCHRGLLPLPASGTRGEGWGEGHKRDGRQGREPLFAVAASSPHPSPPKEEREIESSASGSVKMGPCELLAVEVARRSGEYAWDVAPGRRGFQSECLFEGTSSKVDAASIAARLDMVFGRFKPDVVVVPGWASRASLGSAVWCLKRRVPLLVMSESQAKDEPRSAWREAIKRQIVGCFSAALVGGTPHADYMAQLGMPRERIFLGYDAVDNRYFEDKVAEVRGQGSEVGGQGAEGIGRNAEILKAEILKGESGKLEAEVRPPSSVLRLRHGLPERYFLASARFVEKKNLARLLQAYARYRQRTEDRGQRTERREERGGNAETLKTETLPSEVRKDFTGQGKQKAESTSPQPSPQGGEGVTPWDLVLLGDGPLRADLCCLISDLSLQHSVLLPGFKQYPDLPAYYGLASAFIHASTMEQWGLVVNEAMASGLPVLVSNRCGCAPDLVQDSVNGFTFDPYNVEELAQLMLDISAFQPFSLSAFGDASRTIISDWGPERFANGLKQAVECALRVGPVKPTLLQRMILKALLRR